MIKKQNTNGWCAKNPFYRVGPGIKALYLAAEKAGTKVYAYDAVNFTLLNAKPFRSVRKAANVMSVSAST